ncbi:MAG: hypothetical protein ABR925_02335, partial [Acidimicrobiales bacterium]
VPLGPWGPVRYRMADLGVGTIVRLNPELAKNIAAFDLAGAGRGPALARLKLLDPFWTEGFSPPENS